MYAISSSWDYLSKEYAPDKNMLYAVLMRALGDLDFRRSTEKHILRDALQWFRNPDISSEGGFTYRFVIEQLEPSRQLLQLIAEKVQETEDYLDKRMSERQARRKRTGRMAARARTRIR